ncbi:MAG: hypothetical protein OXU25_03155 [Thaumarchaeota archaeon]|nr:hypothetical protein [Nitrososphaerota archaeon]
MPARHSPRAPLAPQALATPAQRYRSKPAARVFARAPLEDVAPRPGHSALMGFHILDNAEDGPDSAYAHRVATLFRFADRLAAEGALGGPLEDMEVQHRLQKCAYVAQQMGAGIDYEFGFMCSGAFSADLAVDVYQRDAAHGGSDPFAGMAGRTGEFLGLVRGRSTEWLRLLTFAVRPAASRPSRAEFVELVAWRGSGHDRKLAARAFDAVAALRGSGQAKSHFPLQERGAGSA